MGDFFIEKNGCSVFGLVGFQFRMDLDDWFLNDWFLNDWFLNDWFLNDWFLDDWFLDDWFLDDWFLDDSGRNSILGGYAF
jgi:hypothetical protein